MFVYFTDLISKDVFDRHGLWLGRPCDFLTELGEPYPPLTAVVISRGKIRKKYCVIPWDQVQQKNAHWIVRTQIESLNYQPEYKRNGYISTKKDILDQQVVDTFNRKVVRVNDIHFLRVENKLRIAHVDVGLRGLIRRMGWEKIVDSIVRFISPHSTYLCKETLISWKFVQPLTVHPLRGTIQLNVDQGQIKSIPSPDMSEMLVEIDPYVRLALFKSLDRETQIEALSEMDLKQQKELISDLEPKMAVEIIEKMPPDEATDLLGSLSRRHADRLISMMSGRSAKKLSRLISLKADSAGGLMTTEFVTLSDGMTVKEAIDYIKEVNKKVETIYYAYVLDADSRLIGVVTFKHLLFEDNEKRIADVMIRKPVSININASAKEVAYIIDKYNLVAIPVVDDAQVMQGIITIDDILSVVISETWGKKRGLL